MRVARVMFFALCAVVASCWPMLLPEDGVNPETISDGTREGDILLTEQQVRDVMQRKAISYTSRLWPAGDDGVVTVSFTIGSNIQRTKLLEAIDQWRDNTCVAFTEVEEDFDGPHIIFLDSDRCSSYVGLVRSSGQEVQLHSSCVQSVGPAVHEIGHALGFYHEQSRSDRDEFVQVLLENVESGKEGNFNRHATSNYDIPYDFYSIMHYGTTFFSSNGKNTIVAKQLTAQVLIGNRARLSFRDIKLANKVYKCIDTWLSTCGLARDPCRNEGFTGRDCSCVCPPGTRGLRCELLAADYTDALIQEKSPHTEEISTTGTVSTPGYPVPILKYTKFMKVLKAPDCGQVKLTINKLDIYPRQSSGSCAIDSFTIYTTSTMSDGTTYCGKEIMPGTEFASNDTIILEYKNYNYQAINYNSRFTGFTGDISHVPLPGCFSRSRDEIAQPAEAVETSASDSPVFSADTNSGACTFEATDTVNKFLLRSPGYPAAFKGTIKCNLELHSSEPRYLTVAATEEHFSSVRALTATAPGGSQYRINSGTTTVLSANAQISLTSKRGSNKNAFSIELEAVKSDCHQIIELDEQETGSIVLPSTYAPQTYCEWWIKAPVGKRVQLEMKESFSVGTKTNYFCADDKLVIGTDGDPTYSSLLELCGDNAATIYVSSGAQLNVLFSGLNGGSANVEAFYSVV